MAFAPPTRRADGDEAPCTPHRVTDARLRMRASLSAVSCGHRPEIRRWTGRERTNPLLESLGYLAERARAARFGNHGDGTDSQHLDAGGGPTLRQRADNDDGQRVVRQ